MEFGIGFLLGALVGAGIALGVCVTRARAADRLTQQRWEQTEAQMREAFAALAAQALDANSQRLASQAADHLDGKKALIDQSVRDVAQRLGEVRQYLQSVEAQRKAELGHLSESVASLSSTAGDLHKMLASTQRRGAWGERMAEDILRLAGLHEKVNYVKQSAADAAQGRPDFTFFLPNDLKANMDVKFPLESYKAYLDATDPAAQTQCLRQLVLAVRGHIRAVASRGYVDPQAPTVPYVLLFLPSEQVYSLVLSAEPDLVDEALARQIVLCGPMTLYAMLSVMRQAAQSHNLMKTAHEVIALLGEFEAQWEKYTAEMDKLGDRLDSACKQFDSVRKTRTNVLERPLRRIQDLRMDAPESPGA